MKKYLSLLLVMFLLFALVGCNAKKDDSVKTQVSKTPESTPVEKIFNDKTASVVTFSPDDYTEKITSGELMDFAKIYADSQELYENSADAVYGTVKEISYFDESGAAHILYTFAVEKVYKGELCENDLISVFTSGGYVRLSKYIEIYGKGRFEDYTDEEINNTLIYSDNMGVPIPAVGDKYLLFLSPINNEPPFPDGAYGERGLFMGRYVEQGDDFIRYTPKNEPNFYNGGETKVSKTDMEANLAKFKEQAK